MVDNRGGLGGSAQPPWLPVLSEAARVVWQRRGDAWSQLAALALTVVVSAPSDLRLACMQGATVAVGAGAAYLLGLLPGAKVARNALLAASAALTSVVTALGHPGVGQVVALVPVLLGAGFAVAAPHPDDGPTLLPPDPADGGQVGDDPPARLLNTHGGLYRSGGFRD